jgi:spermidine/putrescine-binding protein
MDKATKIGGIVVALIAFGFVLFGCWPTRYDCSQDKYNCSDFEDQQQAQKVLDYCTQSTGLDIHKLDPDNNEVACD